VRVREPFNAATHAVGVLAAIVGLVFLVRQAQGALATTAYAVYGASLVLLYLASTLYHSLPVSEAARTWLRKLDHGAVFLLIAGSYTPVTLLALPPGWGWSIFGVVWGVTAVGIVTKTITVELPRWADVAIYVSLGWVAVVGVKPLVDAVSWAGLAWLAAGGLAYTVGAIIYATDWPDPLPEKVGAHGIWHLFVLAGSAFHYVFVAGYVPNT